MTIPSGIGSRVGARTPQLQIEAPSPPAGGLDVSESGCAATYGVVPASVPTQPADWSASTDCGQHESQTKVVKLGQWAVEASNGLAPLGVSTQQRYECVTRGGGPGAFAKWSVMRTFPSVNGVFIWDGGTQAVGTHMRHAVWVPTNVKIGTYEATISGSLARRNA